MSIRDSIKRRVEALEAARSGNAKPVYRVRFVFCDPVPGEEVSLEVIKEPSNKH